MGYGWLTPSLQLKRFLEVQQTYFSCHLNPVSKEIHPHGMAVLSTTITALAASYFSGEIVGRQAILIQVKKMSENSVLVLVFWETEGTKCEGEELTWYDRNKSVFIPFNH